LSKSDTVTISDNPAFESPRDKARFRRMPGFAAVDLMDASFRDHHFAPHTHDELMLGVMRAGVKRFVREGRAYTVGPGGISVVNPGEVHTGGRFEGERLVYTALYVPRSFYALAGLSPRTWFRSGVAGDADIWRLFMSAAAADADSLKAQEDLLEALARLGRHGDGRRAHPQRDCSRAALRAIDFVHANYADTLTIADLSGLSGITPRHMIRSFRKATGLPPHAYLRQVRIERAKAMLAGDMPLAEIALATGFADQPHFTKAFRQIFGTTPGRYRMDVARAS